MNSNQIFAELVNRRNQAGRAIYDRLVLVQQLLTDKDWVQASEHGGGDESLALDRLEEECFGDLCGALSLPQLLEVLHHVPNEADWKRNKYKLKQMWDEMKARSRGPQVIVQKPAPQDELNLLRNENRELKQQVKMLTQENRRLHSMIQRIKKDVGELQTA